MKTMITIKKICLSLSLLFASCGMANGMIFEKYKTLSHDLTNELEVSQFISEKNYLSDRLKKKWLLHLAKQQRWYEYLNHYEADNNTTRKCFFLQSLYHTNQKTQALAQVKDLWMVGKSQPGACNFIFARWQESVFYEDSYLFDRFKLAINQDNIRLANSLRKKMNDKADNLAALSWLKIHRRPHLISSLHIESHPKKNEVIAHGLKLIAREDPDKAIKQWQKLKQENDFLHQDSQEILQIATLYKAIRNHDDAEYWFNQLDIKLMPHTQHEWRARTSLKNENWTHVINIINTFPTELKEKPCWQYWMARSLEKTGEKTSANNIYHRIAKKRHYYGFLASYRLKKPIYVDNQSLADNKALLAPYEEQVKYIKLLYKENDLRTANLLSYELSNDLTNEQKYQLAKTYARWQWYDKSLMLANLSHYKDDIELRFPLVHKDIITKYASQYNVKRTLVYAIIRQESTFREKVRSHAGAIGLMQVIPSTAKRVAKRKHIPLSNIKNMYTAKTNVHIGTAYLQLLNKRFDSHPILVAAAYNAGPRQVNYWLKKHPPKQADIWVETLPWSETRNYLKNVTAFYAVYQHRLEKSPSIDIFMKTIN